MKTKDKNPASSDKKDKMDRQRIPQQPEQGQPDQHRQPRPEQGQPEHRQPQQPGQEPRQWDRESQARMPEIDRRPDSPRERSDEDSIGRPVQLGDELQTNDLQEPDSPNKPGQRRDR